MLVRVSSAAASSAACRIGEWWVDPATNEIRRDGEAARLEPKVMEVLVYLAARPGRVVSREELLSALWPGVVVGDDTLTQAVIKLRKALQDSARSPAYIETISKRGYRLVARVGEGAASSAEPAATVGAGETDAPLEAQPRTRWLWVFGTTGIALLILAAVVILYQRQRAEDDESWLAAHLPALEKELAQRPAALPAVAVMPFEALAQEADQVYLAGGITADLTTDLSRLSGLRVVSISGPAGTALEGAAAARYIVSGTVQRISGKLKVNVRLVDNQSAQQLWAERYERSLGDPFALNEEIIARLLEALSVRIRDAERARLAGRYTRNLDAYDYFLRGQAAYLARERTENSTAREMYRRAVELDPAFARAYAGLALTHTADYRNQWVADPSQALARAAELAETAVRIDPQLPDVYAVLGYVRVLQGQHKQAISTLRRAVELDRFYADAYAYLGAAHTNIGQPAKTVPLLRIAMRLNPETGFIYFLVLGRAYLFHGDLEQASINLRAALARNPGDLETRVFMAATLVAAGNLGEARWETEEIRTLQPDFSTGRWLKTHPMTDAGQRERLMRLLAQVGL